MLDDLLYKVYNKASHWGFKKLLPDFVMCVFMDIEILVVRSFGSFGRDYGMVNIVSVPLHLR